MASGIVFVVRGFKYYCWAIFYRLKLLGMLVTNMVSEPWSVEFVICYLNLFEYVFGLRPRAKSFVLAGEGVC